MHDGQIVVHRLTKLVADDLLIVFVYALFDVVGFCIGTVPLL